MRKMKNKNYVPVLPACHIATIEVASFPPSAMNQIFQER